MKLASLRCNQRRFVVERKLPGSKPPWEFQPQRPDTDHFNRDYHPDRARGGTQLSLLDPKTNSFKILQSPKKANGTGAGVSPSPVTGCSSIELVSGKHRPFGL